jgi:hypothetical protein
MSVLNSFLTDPTYPKNLDQTLQINEASVFAEHLSNYLRLTYNRHHNFDTKIIEVIKHLPIFIEIDNNKPISLLPGHKQWYLLPHDEEKSYGKIIYPNDKGGFLSTTNSQNFLLENIIEISRLNSYNYWKYFVLPFIESQNFNDKDKVIDKLFDRLPTLLDESFKDVLGNISFVPTSSIKMLQNQQIPSDANLVKPIELFDPEEKSIIDLFFDNEQVFPAGKYGSSSNKFLPILKKLGMKSELTSNDIISRINNIVIQRQNSSVQEILIHSKAFKLFKYIDEKWDTFNINDTQNNRFIRVSNNNLLLSRTILEKEWIPTVDVNEKIHFSKAENCYCQKDKDLICLISPIFKSKIKNKKFLKFLNWDNYPKVEKVLEQLVFCYRLVFSKQSPKNLEDICMAIYKYFNEIFEANSRDITSTKREFEIIKGALKNNSWILCGEKFYPAEKVVFNLPSKFHGNNSIIVQLPTEYNKMKPLFRYMGVRDEIGVNDLILIIKNMVIMDKNKIFSANEIINIIRILEQIAKIQKENKREGNNREILNGLLIPSTENTLVDLQEIQFDDMADRLDDDEKQNYKLAHRLVTLDIAKELELQTLSVKIYGNYSHYLYCTFCTYAKIY